jgi:hypothetical protein
MRHWLRGLGSKKPCSVSSCSCWWCAVMSVLALFRKFLLCCETRYAVMMMIITELSLFHLCVIHGKQPSLLVPCLIIWR